MSGGRGWSSWLKPRAGWLLEAVTRLYQAGGLTLAQDEASSVVFGMNRRAIEAGVIDRVLTLEESAAVLRSFF
jgi:chemotaxis response regulator CheB